MRTELLAPAKNKETAFSAIDAGADAVYIGASSFGARHSASNSLEDIVDVVNYAHKFWVKVFITVNTILTDDELPKAVELVKNLDKIGVDAVLVQDMGLLLELKKLLNKSEITIPIHMSTQCDNRDIEKIKFFENIGVSRVVLPRETSLDKIKDIRKTCPNIELEGFIHGALCVSYSGQCYLSQYIGGRSANRGDCAQPCRKKYTVKTDNGKILAKDIHSLCLKDFNASKHIKEMISRGIFSFKIEGRLKEEDYVKNVVAYYRKELDKFSDKISSGKSIYNFEPDPARSFNRGFTDFFLEQRKDCWNFISPKSRGKYIGTVISNNKNKLIIKTDYKISPQDGLCFETKSSLEGFLVNKTEVDGKKATIFTNRSINLEAGTKIYRNNDIEFGKKLTKKIKRQIGVNVEVNNNKLTLTDENNISVSYNLDFENAKNISKMKETFIKQFSKTGDSDFYINSFEIISDIPFIPVSKINELRRNLFEELMTKRIKNYKRDIQKPLNLNKYYKNEVDYRANIHNKKAKEFYENLGCSVLEMSLENSKPNRQIELMRTKHCIKFALNICKSPENLILEDEYGKEYPLKFDCTNCEMVLLSPKV